MHVSQSSLAETGAVQAHQRGGSYETGGVDAGIRRRLDVVLEHSAEPLQCQEFRRSQRNSSIMKESTMHAQQEFSPRDFSLSPVDLIPPEDSADDEVSEVDARRLRYARLATLVDIDDIAEMVCARLKESVQLRYLIEDAIADPHDLERPHVHINDALHMAQDVLVEVVTAVDEQISLLDVVEG
jgi:hypothetical protein